MHLLNLSVDAAYIASGMLQTAADGERVLHLFQMIMANYLAQNFARWQCSKTKQSLDSSTCSCLSTLAGQNMQNPC